MTETLSTVDVAIVDPSTFAHELALAWSPRLAAMLTDYRDGRDIPRGSRCYLLIGGSGGFIITPEGDLRAVFTTVSGTGSALALLAIRYGARTLDAFDGFLAEFWTRHGFVSYRREANWTEGEPDNVYYRLGCDIIPCPMGSIHVIGDHQ